MNAHHRKYDGPNTVHHRKFDQFSMVQKLGGAILAAAAVVALCWRLMAEPCIQKQIDETTNPIIDVLEYQTYLMMQTMTDEQVKKADDSYVSAKRMKVNRGE